MHAVGFWHEQSRPDRDDHVIINWNNIENGKRNINYMKQNESSMIGEYDLCSIMHYSVDGKYMSLAEYGPKETECYVVKCYREDFCFVQENRIGKGLTFTTLDIWKINTFYKDVCMKVEILVIY